MNACTARRIRRTPRDSVPGEDGSCRAGACELGEDEWLDTLAASGIRAVVAPGFRDARWFTRNGHALEYEWDDAAGKEAFARARTVIDLAALAHGARYGG